MQQKYCSELHIAYENSIMSFAKSYPNADEEMIAEINSYSRMCALIIWSMFQVEANDCLAAIREIYTSNTEKADYTKERMEKILEELYGGGYSVPVQDFFWDIIDYDVKNHTNFSRRLAACFQILDIIYAMIDDCIEEGEATLISQRQKELLNACDIRKVVPFHSDINVYDYVKNQKDKLIVTAGDGKWDTTIEAEKVEKKKTEREKNVSILQTVNTKKETTDELDSLIGLMKAKKEIHEVSNFARIQRARQDQGLPVSDISYHLVFTGNPGTGKTTVARLVAKIYKDLGIVSEGQLIEASAKDLVAGYVGQTAIKTGEIIEKAKGGVLFIDEAYTLLDKTGQGYGQEAIDTLLKEMEDHRDDLVVIVAGYDEQMKEFIGSNPGLQSRFNKYIHFDDYTPEEMYQIFELLCSKGAYRTSLEASKLLKDYFVTISENKDESFANGRTVRNVFEKVISKQASRISQDKNITAELLSNIEEEDVVNSIGVFEADKEESLEDVLKEFHALIGLEQVKEEISELVYIAQNQQRRKAQGLRVPSLSLHLVFMGNPGTGKTTVARCVARIYKCLGLLSKGQLIETDRSGLVAGYVGQTAIKTQEVMQKAFGGVLFIDEAYTLANGGANDFGQEAIDTLLKGMEDHRDDLVVIVAGYDDLMGDFIRSNPGLESRFNRYIHFEDYSAEQLSAIFSGLCVKNQYVLSDGAKNVLGDYFNQVNASEIGNGRGVRNLFEKVVTQQAKRIERNPSAEGIDLQLITEEDISIICRITGTATPSSEMIEDEILKNVVEPVKIVESENGNTYSLNILFPNDTVTRDLYKELKGIIFGIEPTLEETVKKRYVTFKYQSKFNTVSLWPKSGWIEVVLNAKIGQITDSYNLIYDITNRKWSSEQYAFKFYPDTNRDEVRDIILQTINLKR